MAIAAEAQHEINKTCRQMGYLVRREPKMPKQSLTISMTPRDGALPVSSLVRAIQQTVGGLRAVDKAASESGHPALDWCVEKASMKSPFTMTIAGVPRNGKGAVPDAARPFLVGLRAINSGAQRPPGFTNEALTYAKGLVGVLADGVSELRLSSGRHTVRLTHHVAANVDSVLGIRREYYVMTELDGRLESISVHGQAPDFCIYDPITNQPIRCIFSPDDIGRAADLIKARARVRVSGRAKYNRKDQPISVEVQEFVTLREQGDLPQIRDLHKACIDITGGQDSVEYVRGIRDAE